MAQSLGDRLRQARREMAARLGRDVTQADVAERVGVTQVTIGRYENNQKEPSLEMIAALAKVFSVDAGYLAFGGQAPPAVRGKSGPIHMTTDAPLVGGTQPAAATKHAAGTKRVR